MPIKRLWWPMLGYKAVLQEKSHMSVYEKYGLVTLRIPVGAQVYLTEKKCRASHAMVLSIEKLRFAKPLCTCSSCTKARAEFVPGPLSRAVSIYTREFVYVAGKAVRPELPFSLEKEECASGIHFFRTKDEAVDFVV